MMEFLGARVSFNPRPVQLSASVLEVAMIGHCPGEVRVERLLQLKQAVAEIRSLGFGARVDELSQQPSHLYHLPIPLHSLAEFEDIFPDARSAPTQYRSVLAGDCAWLPQAVEDFFANQGEKLWVIQVPEDEHIQGFLPTFESPLYDTHNLRGLASALILNDVGLVAMPDLERIQIPAQLPDISRPHLTNPEPQFLPTSMNTDDGCCERRNSEEIIHQPEPIPFVQLLRNILSLVVKHRPDMQCLFSLPLGYSPANDTPEVDVRSLADIDRARHQTSAYMLRQVQLLFPYIRSSRYALRSTAGMIAGLVSSSAIRRGVWRSVAGLALETDARPYPSLSMMQTTQLRNTPGVGVIQQRAVTVTLDDERLCVPALHRTDYTPGQVNKQLDSLRSGEVVRFIGFLTRQLKSLGETMIFNVDDKDPRPRLILENFFNRLFTAGALRGSTAEKAFSIKQNNLQEGVISYDIEIAPAHPIDKIDLTFVNRNGIWFPEVNYA